VVEVDGGSTKARLDDRDYVGTCELSIPRNSPMDSELLEIIATDKSAQVKPTESGT
jgi:hypothetical protein